MQYELQVQPTLVEHDEHLPLSALVRLHHQ